jgi:signal transduction histidine kinase
MLERAIPEVKKDQTAAIAKFRNGEAGFKDRDLYVFCFDNADGKILTTYLQNLIGTDIRTLKDTKGRGFGQNLFDTAKEGQINESGSYTFNRPGAAEPAEKISYVTRIGAVTCGVGYYK